MNFLKNIPHLQLPINFGVDSLCQEAEAVQDQMIGYELPGGDRTEEEREQYRHNWKGRGLIDFESDSSKGMLDAREYQGQPSPFNITRDADDKVVFVPTDLGQCAHHCMAVINHLFDKPGRCRLTSMAAGGSLNWHSHCQFKTGNYDAHDDYDLAIVHVPIITNPSVLFGVNKFHHDDVGLHPHWQHYGVGECWLLNGWHEHNVVNKGDTDRIHLMMYGSLRDPRLVPLILEGMKQYEGPQIA